MTCVAMLLLFVILNKLGTGLLCHTLGRGNLIFVFIMFTKLGTELLCHTLGCGKLGFTFY
jgi:hypothetical protein